MEKKETPPAPQRGEKKEIRITIRLTEEEKERLKKIAKEEGMTLSDYVRSKLTEAGVRRRRKPQTEETRLLRELLFQINRIGVNLNQIARALNTALKTAPSEDFFSAVYEAIETLGRIEENLHRLTEEVK